METGDEYQSGALWRDRPNVAPANPTGADLARLVRRGFGLRTFEPPTLPGVAARVLEAAKSSEADLKGVSELIEQDMLLSAQILRLMQTPIYNRGIEITSIEQAVNRLGLKAVRNVVAEAALNANVFTSDAYQKAMDQLRRHSAATAQVAQLVSSRTGIDHDLAFLSGLFHDVGLAAPLLLVGEVYENAPPALDAVWSELVWLHEKLNWHVMRFWKLPDAIREIIRFHHCVPDEARDPMGSAIVCLADKIVEECGVPHTLPELQSTLSPSDVISDGSTSGATLDEVMKRLGVASVDYSSFLVEGEQIIEQLT